MSATLKLQDKIKRFRNTSWFKRANHKQRTHACNVLAHQTYWDLPKPFKVDRSWLRKNHPRGKKYVKPAEAA